MVNWKPLPEPAAASDADCREEGQRPHLARSAPSIFSEDDVRSALVRAIEKAGSQQAFADATGFSKQYVSNVVRRHRRGAISEALAQALGFRREVVYIPQPTTR